VKRILENCLSPSNLSSGFHLDISHFNAIYIWNKALGIQLYDILNDPKGFRLEHVISKEAS